MSSKLLTAAEAAELLGKPEQIAKARPIPTLATPRIITVDEREQRVADDFREDVARHAMTVFREDGLYRHIRFSNNPRGYGEYWFDLITWPGSLTIRGDYGDAYTFSREPDMFPFFRSSRYGINPHYWAQKLDRGTNSVKTYSEDLFRQLVVEHFVDSVQYSDAPRGLGKAIRAEILNQDLTDEREARDLLESFEYEGFEFHDVWEWSFGDWDRSFLWACHAIAWGIARYDRVRNYGLQQLAVGDLAASAVAEDRCLKAPAGCGKPLVADDGTTRVFWDEDEAARYEKEWRTTGLCPDCQDLAEAVAS